MKRKLLWALATVATVLCLFIHPALAAIPLLITCFTIGKSNQYLWFVAAIGCISTLMTRDVAVLFIIGSVLFYQETLELADLKQRIIRLEGDRRHPV